MNNVLSFKQWLNEVWHSTMKSSYIRGATATEIHRNPSRKDIPSISSGGQSRAIFHGDDVDMWDGEKAFHDEVHKHIGAPKDSMHAIVDHKRKTVEAWHSQSGHNHGWNDHELDNHPWVKRNGYKTNKYW